MLSRIILAHCSASPSVRPGPPTTLTRAPLASEISISRRGDCSASMVAFSAPSSTEASPRPIIATPPPFSMTERRSWKSRLTTPSLAIISETPDMLLIRSSSATLNAASRGRSLTPSTSSSLSFGRTITVSHTSLSLSSPHSAFCLRTAPSDTKG